ncbi:hypothetical protein FJ250_05170, partial [bacterium]|nr:hypothetical protein [bacterium]
MSPIARTFDRSRVPSLVLLLLGLALAGSSSAAPAAAAGEPATVAAPTVTLPTAAPPAVTPPIWRVLEATPTSLRVELEIPGYLRRPAGEPDHPGAVDLVVPGGGETGEVGAPMLPTVSRLVAIPAGMQVTGAVVEQTVTVLEDLDLAPLRVDEEAPFARAADAYAVPGWRQATFPSTAAVLSPATKAARAQPIAVAAVGRPAILAGQPVVALSVAPVAYDAVARRALAADRVVIELRFAPGPGGVAPARARPLPASFAALAGGQVLGLPREKLLPAVGAEPGLWVAVARNNATVLTKLQPLLDWRRRQG